MIQNNKKVIGNEEDASDVLGIKAADSDAEKGELDIAAYGDVARQIHQRFPQLSHIAITLRESISADANNWGAMLHDCKAGADFLAPLNKDGEYSPYPIHDIVDRVGGGDSFAAGLLFALNTDGLSSPETAIKFAVASSCLKHSIPGDFNYVTRDEVEALMKGNTSGRVRR